jgi:hypothetical protein
MQWSRWTGHGRPLVGVALALVFAAAARAQAPPPTTGPEGPQPRPFVVSDHWIGVECAPVPPPLRAQVDLPEGQGLLVGQVVPESPAAKAGIQQYDVLVKADGKPLAGIEDLVGAVDAAKDKQLTIELVRGGKTHEIHVQPEKRPEGILPGPPPQTPNEAFRKLLEPWTWQGGRQPWRLRLWGPGAILPPHAKIGPPMPGNMSVTISKKGDKPARIVVKRGNQKWEVTEDQLDKLPPDVRGHVERMLGRTILDWGDANRSSDFELVPEQVPDWGVLPERGLHQRLEEMNRRIEQLRKSIDQLREERPRPKAAEPELKAPEKKQNQV